MKLAMACALAVLLLAGSGVGAVATPEPSYCLAMQGGLATRW